MTDDTQQKILDALARLPTRDEVKTIVQGELQPLEGRMQALEGTVQTLGSNVQALEGKVQALDEKMDKGFTEVGETQAGILALLSREFDSIHKSVGYWSHDIDELRDRLRVLETKVEQLQQAGA